MPTYTLKPLRHAEPKCADFSDEALVRDYELAMRVHRAAVEPFHVEPFDSGWRECAYQVSPAERSGSSYLVDIIDDSGAHDACTCADFASNRLGTCKHIEAVRRALREVPALRRLPALSKPRVATVTVDARGVRPRLVVVGPRAGALLSGVDEAIASHGVGAIDRVLERAAARSVRVVHAARPTLARLVEEEQRSRRREHFDRALADGDLSLDVLAAPLFPYQLRGVAHLVGAGRALLADDMGLGKTVQAIAAAEVLRRRGEAERTLVVTPASLKAQWAREIERYAGRSALVVTGGPAQRRQLLTGDGAAYVIVNYELLWRDPGLAREVGADLLILDEAQRAKNFRTRTAESLRALSSRFLFVLTGTPIENRLDDLYSLLQLVDPAVLGPLWRFNLDFHRQESKNRRTGYRNLADLRARIAPHVLRRRKDEVLSQLPPLSSQTRHVALSAKQEELEAACRADAAQWMAIAERRALRPEEHQKLMAALLKARQACNAAVLCDGVSADDGSGKLDELEQLVGEIVAQGSEKVLVFSEWTEMLRLASDRLEKMGVGHSLLHGGVPTEKRPALLDAFRADPQQRVLLSTDAGGVGLNLQAASYVVHLDLPWNPGRLDQRTARAHRLGQTRGVSVIYLCAATGIERGIEGTLAGKRDLRGAALDPTSGVDDLTVPSFTSLIRELRGVLGSEEPTLDEGTPEPVGTPEPDASPEPDGAPEPDSTMVPTSEGAHSPAADLGAAPKPDSSPTPTPDSAAAPNLDSAAVPAPDFTEQSNPMSAGGAPTRKTVGSPRAVDRLRLAEVVLAAGFPSDAVRAAYDSLAAQIATLLERPPGHGHAALVGAIYRELIPSGRAPEGLTATLARLHDLTLLEAEGVPVDAALADAAVAEARAWVGRMG